NGSEPGYFLIDTGGSEVILDDEFAKSVGAPDFGAETGTFAGGQRAPVHQSSIESLQLGELEVRNVPAHILSTRRFSAVAQGKRVDGILGTILFYHFRTTLDYRTGELILERRTGQAASPPAGAVVMPFWMAGDHLMLAWGRMNGAGPFLWFVDTGLAGPGFTGPRATITEAGIELPSQPTAQGQGGGGRVSVTPFAVAELSLGDAAEKNIVGVFGPFPESLEMSHGFRIAGIISHQFFRRYAVTFDFDAMQLILVRSS
ncbi:MAG TPA: aspartyl protease family protein, partial [Gemmatimonadales bacterium]|nr:aspartyl protease family protein [Gemmatimonadales bacterium]